MEKYVNDFKFVISYRGRSTTVDLRRIVAINHPDMKDMYFCVFFESAIWKVPVSEHDKLYKAWMGIKELV